MRFDGFDQAVSLVTDILEEQGLVDFHEDSHGDYVMDDSHRVAARKIVEALFPELI